MQGIQKRNLILLRMLGGALAWNITPHVTDPAAQRAARLGAVQLGRFLIEQTAMPPLKANAIAS